VRFPLFAHFSQGINLGQFEDLDEFMDMLAPSSKFMSVSKSLPENPSLLVVSSDRAWITLVHTLHEDYDILDVSEDEVWEAIRIQGTNQTYYDLIILDANSVSDTNAWVHFLHRFRPDMRIAIVTATPDWQTAREYFRQGATDYFF
jgi:ActR/RegA family two-component response regulator